MIDRPYYINWLNRWREKNVIKVITGLRRCGKSSVLQMYRQQLLDEGISPNNIQSYNFEEINLELPKDVDNLYLHIVSKMSASMNYIFLDEIQHIADFERLADALFVRNDVDLYLTGSNSFFLSQELATLLTGRYVEIRMLPLSFKELRSADSLQNLSNEDLFERYLTYGGMPFVAQLEEEQDITDYLSGVFNTIIINDAIARHPQMNMRSFLSTAQFVADNIGSITSLNRISNGLKKSNKGVSTASVSEYLGALTENFLAFEAQRYNIKGKALLETLQKYYLGDLGFRHWLLGSREGDLGHKLENIIYLELLRRYKSVYVGKVGDHEIDFIALKSDTVHYFQVALTVLDENTLRRELYPLQNIKDNHQKTLLTLDRINIGNFEGINHINIISWLLED